MEDLDRLFKAFPWVGDRLYGRRCLLVGKWYSFLSREGNLFQRPRQRACHMSVFLSSGVSGLIWLYSVVELAVESFWVRGIHYFDPFVPCLQELSFCGGLENGDCDVSLKDVPSSL